MTDLEVHLAHVSGPRRKRKVIQGGVFGIGTNDVEWKTQWYSNQLIVSADPAYIVWKSMYSRCDVGGKVQSRRSTYVGCSVCNEWRTYSAFAVWWKENQVEGWSLDKDLLIYENKQYGPLTCVFVPQWLNTFTIDRGKSRGAYPIGVSENKGRFIAQINNGSNKIAERLGSFSTPQAAHEAWENRKLELALSRKSEMDVIDPRIYEVVVQKIISS